MKQIKGKKSICRNEGSIWLATTPGTDYPSLPLNKKINVDTDGRLAMTGAVRKVFAEHPSEFDPRVYFGAAREAVYDVIRGKMINFGTAGHMNDYEPVSLEDAKKYYH